MPLVREGPNAARLGHVHGKQKHGAVRQLDVCFACDHLLAFVSYDMVCEFDKIAVGFTR